MAFTEETLQQVDRLIQARPAAENTLRPFRGLLCLMIRSAAEIDPLRKDGQVKDTQQQAGFPLFSREELNLDFGMASALLSRFFHHLRDAPRDDREGMQRALQTCRADADWPVKVFDALLRQDKRAQKNLGKEVDLNPTVLCFLAGMALKPSLHALRDAMANEIDRTAWDHGYCPFCGSQPAMAYLNESGRRFLHCELCGEEWPHPRLSCPFCKNQDHETLAYFHAEAEEGFRVDYCRKCRRYLKTIDKRVLEDAAPMELEHLATLHLDILATEQGLL